MPYKLKSSLNFLLFLLLFTQGNILLKLLGLGFIYAVHPISPFSRKVSRQEFFFVFIILYSLTSFVFIVPFEGAQYTSTFFLGLIFWILCFLAFKQIFSFVKNNPVHIIHNTADNYFIVVALFTLSQYIFLAYQDSTWNPYISGSLGMSTGDHMKGVFANSSINMVISSFFVAYYANQKNWKRTALAAVVMLSTTYMSGIALFFAGLGILLFTTAKISLVKKLGVLSGGFILFAMLLVVSPENINYATNNILNIFTENPPRKIISLFQTLSNWTSGVSEFMYGEGLGRFSSRLAFTAGGEYVSWFPESQIYRNSAFEENHFKLWNKEALAIPYNDGTANQPFSIYNQFLGEYGLIGIFALFFFYLGSFFKRYKHLTYGKLILITTLGYFLLDYWFEYFSVLFIFELLMLLDLKKNEEIENVKA